jgi:DNA-binding CsgD family transcriptional regulator
MTSSGVLEERAFAEVKRLCYAGLDSAALRREAIRALGRAVPFDYSCVNETDPASGLVMRMTEEPADPARGRQFLERVYFEGVLDAHRRMAGGRVHVRRLSEATGGQLERDPVYRELSRPRGQRFDLRAVFVSGGELWGAAIFSRERERSDFSDREVALVGRLAPHLGAGLRAAILRARADEVPEAEGAPGVLVLNGRGEVVQHTPPAERWMRELGELGPGWREGRGLPDAVWAALGALREALRADPAPGAAGVPAVHVRGRSGAWLRLQASAAESAAGRAGERVVVIEPARPHELSRFRVASHELTPREREVADLVVRGASNKEIARALTISRYTVEDHLAHVFEKVGVRGRQELVKRLYLGGLGAPEVR